MKVRALTRAVVLGVLLTATLAGCSRERIDWKSAEAADTQEAYDHFLQLHPDSALATQAHARLAQLAEDKDWQRASTADTADAYKQFLAQHPSGKWAEEARIRMENFTLDANSAGPASPSADTGTTSPAAAAGVAAPGAAAEPATRVAMPPADRVSPPSPATQTVDSQKSSSLDTAHGPPSKPAPVAHTSGPASKPITTASTESQGFGIQLGAFSTQAAALSEWKRLQTTYDAELHGLFAHAVPVQVASGKLFRLQSPVGDEARARSICTALTKHSQPCVVVLPPQNH